MESIGTEVKVYEENIIFIYYLQVRVEVNHASMIHNFAYAEHDKQDYGRGKIELER